VQRTFRSTWQVASLVTFAAWLVYALAFRPLFHVIDSAAVAVSLLPIAVAAWLRGARAGFLSAAIASLPINWALLFNAGWNVEQAIAGSAGAALVFAVVAVAVGYMRDSSRRVYELTLLDPTTHLPNRVAFRHEIERVLTLPEPFAIVALFRVTGFREVNESFGYELGDDLLREVGRRLRVAVEPSAFVARFDGAVFGILSTSAAVSWQTLAESVLSVFDTTLSIGGQELRFDGRVGLAHFPDHGVNESMLLRRAEAALRDAERAATRWVAATPAATLESAGRRAMLAALRAGIANGELRLHYQPVLGLTERGVGEFEALVRWQRADGRLVPPGDFIPLANRSGLIGPLTDWVLDEAMRQAREWMDQGRHLRIAVNVSARSLLPSANLRETVEATLGRHGVDASHLTIEVTETDVMADPEQAIRVLGGLKQLGVHIAVDDFGTGYSSLSYLHQLPLDTVKIDRSFVQRLVRDSNTATIVRAAIDLSHALGLDVVAEGVENAALLGRLTAMGCDKVQGYHIARPMPAADAFAWLLASTATAAVPQAHDGLRIQRSAPAEIRPQQGTVLVVDDEHPLRLAAHRILSAEGFHVIHAATASEALRLCSEYDGQLDLVLTDVFLTDWRGYELAEHLRRQYSQLKVVLMSGDPSAALARETLLLRKPFTKRELIEHVRGALAA